MAPKFKYYTEASGHGANRPGAARCEAILTDWFETPATLQDLANKYNASTTHSISRVIFRAIKRKPSLSGLKKNAPSNVISAANFKGGITEGNHFLRTEVKARIKEARAQGMTFRQIAKELNIGVMTACRHANDIDYRADRADPTEPYGQPHA
jgi:hypothetical protein